MILEFGAENYFSFKENFSVSFKRNSLKKNSDLENILNIMCVKGANASGKTNVLKTIPLLANFICDSFKYEKNEKLPFFPYFQSEEPIKIYIKFLDKKFYEYTYELETTRDNVIREMIHRKKNSKDILIINRESNTFTKLTKEFKELENIKLKDNASLISTAMQYELNSINDIYEIFNNIFSNVHMFGRREQIDNYEDISKIYFNNNDIFKIVENLLIKFDNGISSIEILNDTNAETGKTRHFPIFNYIIDEKETFLTFHSQSSGIKSLYLQLIQYISALIQGSLLVFDEFDINLHPDILPVLLNLFEDSNPKNSQILLSTHNVEIMDKLGKYRTIFVNKEENQSFLYRLDELPSSMVRNDRPLTSLYKTGKIGGRPKIEDAEKI